MQINVNRQIMTVSSYLYSGRNICLMLKMEAIEKQRLMSLFLTLMRSCFEILYLA